MLKLVILGTGNLSKHLGRAFTRAQGVELVQWVGRNALELEKAAGSIPYTTDFGSIAQGDIYLIAVGDDAIGEVSIPLADRKGLVVHTSGTVPLEALRGKDRGVFYPLQSFSAQREVDFGEIPICIEAERPASLERLRALAGTLSKEVHEMGSHQRKILHLAAVFVNNFTNALYGLGQEICQGEGLDFELLKPLILETAQKVQTLPPREAQTGPARRGDLRTMQSHLELLKKKKHRELYILLSEVIRENRPLGPGDPTASPWTDQQ